MFVHPLWPFIVIYLHERHHRGHFITCCQLEGYPRLKFVVFSQLDRYPKKQLHNVLYTIEASNRDFFFLIRPSVLLPEDIVLPVILVIFLSHFDCFGSCVKCFLYVVTLKLNLLISFCICINFFNVTVFTQHFYFVLGTFWIL